MEGADAPVDDDNHDIEEGISNVSRSLPMSGSVTEEAVSHTGTEVSGTRQGGRTRNWTRTMKKFIRKERTIQLQKRTLNWTDQCDRQVGRETCTRKWTDQQRATEINLGGDGSEYNEGVQHPRPSKSHLQETICVLDPVRLSG